ncbi:MAG: aldo/keto reductase, partial [Methanoculleus sp.]|nr:aldo/keto reductase [Methanoculleus sp.]
MAALGRRRFGKTGGEVTSVGLGGEGVLRTYGRHAEANAVIMEALKAGITYFDSAKAYAGSEDYYGETWVSHPDLRAPVFQASKSASRHHADAEMDLQETLRRMGIETLDLWQIHDVRTFPDI